MSFFVVLATLVAQPAGQVLRRPEAVPDMATPSAIVPATALDLAASMEIPLANVVSATLTTSDPVGVGTGNAALGRFFPRQGGTFTILSTGAASSAEAANTSASTSRSLSGLNTNAGQDLVQLRVVLSPPAGARCLGFDFAFFSEEFPEFVGSRFNDVFLAELGGSNFQISGPIINAPLNFAVDPAGNLISINSVFGVSPNTQSTYDGATTVLRAVAPLAPSSGSVELVLSIADVGDSIYDSSVFLDNFSFSSTTCSTGTALADMIVSPQSGLITPGETFDFTLLATQPVNNFTVRVNGLDISNVIAGCIRGTRIGGGSTIRCPGITGSLLARTFGAGPFVFTVTANFANGATRSETVTYKLVAPSDISALPLALLPASSLVASTQRFDLVVVVRTDVNLSTLSITADGINVTPILLPCILNNPVELVAGGAAYAGRCSLSGAVISQALGAGPHAFRLNAGFSSGPVRSDSFIVQVQPNTEP